eukprot:CAMPEP_0116863268 /NCGR_PEP_ID=MMETSP0418-20121206/24123_1 /TAXON_ID=1158023 /ORGANISM="Astrosyne radiata, Strain 13vi08-1A" /LENGTH=763 /DNA_ID=CAMNT_0004498261 /DNA_START=117 /DNA_END=2410 /DNA_ORIENTATION=-
MTTDEVKAALFPQHNTAFVRAKSEPDILQGSKVSQTEQERCAHRHSVHRRLARKKILLGSRGQQRQDQNPENPTEERNQQEDLESSIRANCSVKETRVALSLVNGLGDSRRSVRPAKGPLASQDSNTPKKVSSNERSSSQPKKRPSFNENSSQMPEKFTTKLKLKSSMEIFKKAIHGAKHEATNGGKTRDLDCAKMEEPFEPNSNPSRPTPAPKPTTTKESKQTMPRLKERLAYLKQTKSGRLHSANPRSKPKQSQSNELEESETRANLDKRTARLRYSGAFSGSIAEYRQHNSSTSPKHDAQDENLMNQNGFSKNGVAVVIRKRPMFDCELDRGEFDVVFPEAGKSNDHDVVVVHKCEMHADMRHQLMKRVSFKCSAAFDDDCSDDDIYRYVASPLVRLAKNGGVATILLHGQTGSGKTYTMSAIERRAGIDVFNKLSSDTAVEVQFVELSGECRDLLEGGDVKLVDRKDGSVQFANAAVAPVKSSMELERIIARGRQNRATEATDKNVVSSRSHAVCQITISNKGQVRPQRKSIKIVLVPLLTCPARSVDFDRLAGSERRNDSMYHNKHRQAETQVINTSLYALKECIRSISSGTFVNYRADTLTRVLRESFERRDSRLCVIATVAPNATDTEHTLETLRTVSALIGVQENVSGAKVSGPPRSPRENLLPRQWDNEQLSDWMIEKKHVKEPIPGHITGKMVMRMNPIQLKNTFYSNSEAAKASHLFQMLRNESERVAKVQHQERMAVAEKTNKKKLRHIVR